MNGRRQRARSECYAALAECFGAPERQRWLHDGTCQTLGDVLDDLYPLGEAATHASALQRSLLDTADLDLRIDHAALFVGPSALEAPPYGSVYLEPGHRLMGDTTLAAAAYYAEAGLDPILPEPPDHVAIELEFLTYLAARAAEAQACGDEAVAATVTARQARFLEQHLGAWAAALCDRMRSGARTPFYRALADCLEAFVDAELGRVPA